MSNPRLAKSLVQLRDQINAAYSGRDKSSDGWIGDTSHANRKSDHNPNAKGVVTAIDLDEDLSPAIHSIEKIVDSIRASRDPRVKYIIYEGRITVQGSDLQKWKKYTGANAHEHHAHISVATDPKLYDDARPWAVFIEPPKASAPAPIVVQQPSQSPSIVDLKTIPPDTGQMPIILPSAKPVEVATVSAEPQDKIDSTINKWSARFVAIPTAVLTFLGGIWTTLTSAPTQVTLTLIIGGLVIAGVYFLAKMIMNSRDKARADAIQADREARAHEVQIKLIEAAADTTKNTVKLVNPPNTTLLNSDLPPEESVA